MSRHRRRRFHLPRHPFRWLGAGLFVFVLAVAAWSLAEPEFIGVSHAIVTSPDVPSEFDGTTVAFVSDIHAGRYFDALRVDRLIHKVNEQGADLIILGGDYVGGRSGGEEIFYPRVGGFVAPMGVYAVLGNHDAWEGRQTALAGLERAGVLYLDNESARVRKGSAWIRIAGIEDLDTGRPYVKDAARDIGAKEFAILVSHNPDVFATQLPAFARAFDLALSGHTHAGQVTYFGLGAPVIPSKYGERYRTGWRVENSIPILVSRGIGTVDVPLRFFAPPEINVIQLRRGKASIQH